VIVLGLIDSKPSAAAVLHEDRILAAVAEERLCRKKMATGFPRQAISEALRVAGVAPREVDHVAVAQEVSVFQSEPAGWDGWFQGELAVAPTMMDRVGAQLAPWLGRSPVAWKLHHAVKALVSRERVRAIPRILGKDFGIGAPVRFYDHHYCHATSAYYTSGFDEGLVITLDGGGDGLSGSVYRGRAGKLRRLAAVDSFNSLGNVYSYVTALCGFRAERDEGKITGLAARGSPQYASILRRFVEFDGRGGIRYRVPMYHASAVRKLRKALPADFDIADLAASAQLILEEIGVAFVRHWMRSTGSRKLGLAGGVFANVKLNQRISEIDEVEELVVHPAMDDGGLSVGSAFAAVLEHRPAGASRLGGALANVFLGPAYPDQAIREAVRDAGFEPCRPDDINEAIAERLAAGDVVARFWGRMEYGPRALGARSILYQTTDPSVNDWLNERLGRTEFMPFAPATLREHASRCYVGTSGVEDSARFMRSRSPGVVHVDGTARPQLVDAQTAPDFHDTLAAYHRKTGIPSLINTSFNMHEEPIVCTPRDALKAFERGHLDWLAIGDYLVRHPDPRRSDRSGRAPS
jgi:carbamoyltransferase